MKCLLAGDDGVLLHRVRALLARDGLDCPPTHAVSLEVAADRAGRLNSALVILALGTDHQRAMDVLGEVSKTSDAYTVVIGPADNSKLILRTMQEGADEFLDEGMLDSEVSEAVVRFKARCSSSVSEQRGRVISVLACSGGNGSSTVATNVSAALAKQHGACGLIDLRLSAGDLASLLDIRPTYSLENMAEHLDRMDEEMFDQLISRHSSGIHLLASPANLSAPSQVTDRVVRQAIGMLRRRFPYVVIDVDHSLGTEQIEALWQSEIILIVLRLDYISIRNTRRTLDHLKYLGLELDRAVLVLNRYGEHKQVSLKQAEESLGMKISHFIPNDPSRINAAINVGRPVSVQRPFAKISRRLKSLAASVNGQHHVTDQKRGISK